MNKFVLLFALICLFTGLNAQQVNISWGPELKEPKKTDLTSIIGANKQSFYCLRQGSGFFNNDEIYLEKYSRSLLKLEYIRPVRLKGLNDRRLLFERAFVLNHNILVFMSYYDRSEDRNTAFVQIISADDGSVIEAAKEVDVIAAQKRSNAGSFDFVLSADSSKILIMHNEPFDKYANEKFSYKVLNENAKEIWSAALELPYRDKSFRVSNYVVDNDGHVYMLASIEKEKGEKERKKPGYHYALLSYNYQSKQLQEKKIELGDRFISDIAFDVQNNQLIIGGFYSNKSAMGLIGTFFRTMDARTGMLINQGSSDFSTEFLAGFMSKRRAEKHKELYDYRIDHFVTRPDGGIYLIAEQYYYVVSTVCNPRGGCNTTVNYYYNDIIVVNINSDSNVGWVKKLPKYQHTSNDNGFYSSYAMAAANSKLYFIFNDHPKNLKPNSKKVRDGVSRKMITVVATIDRDGNVQKEPLLGSSTGRIYTRPKVSLLMGNKETVLYAIKRRTFKFALVKY